MKNIRVFMMVASVWTALLAGQVFANSEPKKAAWVKETSNDDFTIYTRVIEGKPIREVKIEADLRTSLEALLTILADIETFPDWIPMLSEVSWVAEPNSEGLSYVYMITDVPWPIRDRDIVVRTTIAHNSDTKEIFLTSISEPDRTPEAEGLIRIPSSTATWTIKDNGDGTLSTTLQSHADPGGQIPKWLANFVVVSGPKQMFSQLIDALEDPKWSDPSYPYDMNYVFGYESPLPWKAEE